MKLHDLHAKPDQLEISKDEAETSVPKLVWNHLSKKDLPKTELDKLYKEKEKLWAIDARYSYRYAYHVLKGPFKLGEPAIARDTEFAYAYARDILEGPFKLGEPAIAKDPSEAFNYAYHVLKDPFKLGEPAIAKSEYARRYARDVLQLPPDEAKVRGERSS